MSFLNNIDEKYKDLFYAIISIMVILSAAIFFDLKYNYKSIDDIEKLMVKLNKLSSYVDKNECFAPDVKKEILTTIRGSYFGGFYNYVDGKAYLGKASDVLYYFEFEKPVNYVCKYGGKNIRSYYFKDKWGAYNKNIPQTKNNFKYVDFFD